MEARTDSWNQTAFNFDNVPVEMLEGPASKASPEYVDWGQNVCGRRDLSDYRTYDLIPVGGFPDLSMEVKKPEVPSVPAPQANKAMDSAHPQFEDQSDLKTESLPKKSTKYDGIKKLLSTEAEEILRNPPPAIVNRKVLGKPANTGYSCAGDIKSIPDFLNVLHRERPGVRCIGRKLPNGSFSQEFLFWSGKIGKGIRRKMERYKGQDDVYIAMNLMYNKRRGIDNLKRHLSLYADLDCYKLGLTPQQAYELFCLYCVFIRVPAPSLAIVSGRGLQLAWFIDEDPKARSRWKAVEKYLCEQLAALGADPKVTDAARVLRLPFTHNSKGGDVEILEFHDVVYTLYEIIQGYNIPVVSQKKKSEKKNTVIHPYGTATEKQRKAARSIAERLGVPCPNFDSFNETSLFIKDGMCKIQKQKEEMSKGKKSYRSLRQSYTCEGELGMGGLYGNARIRAIIEDLVTLTRLRKGVDCGREYILFLVRYFVAELTRDFDYALQVCKQVNALFECPLDDSEALNATASAEKHLRKMKLYKYKDSTLSRILQITAEEAQHLNYLSPSAIASRQKAWNRSRKKETYYAKLKKDGKLPVNEKIKAKVTALAELLAKGLNRDAICTELGIGKSTFYRYKKMAEALAGQADAEEEKDSIVHEVPVNETTVSKAKAVPDSSIKEIPVSCNETPNSVRGSHRRKTLFPCAFPGKGSAKFQDSQNFSTPIIGGPRRGPASPLIHSELKGKGACANIIAASPGSWKGKMDEVPNLIFPLLREGEDGECGTREDPTGGRRTFLSRSRGSPVVFLESLGPPGEVCLPALPNIRDGPSTGVWTAARKTVWDPGGRGFSQPLWGANGPARMRRDG